MTTIASLNVVLGMDIANFTSATGDAKQKTTDLGAIAERIWDETRTPMERYEARLAQLNGLLRRGQLDQETYARAVERAARGIDDATNAAGGMLRAVERLNQGLAVVGITFGLHEAVDFIKSSYEAFAEAKLQQDKLAAVLESTGHAAGFTAQQIGQLGSEIQSLTNYDDDAVAGAAAVLATFKQIQGATFTRAIHAITDLSTVMGQDLQSSAVQVGKALNDPIRGITALRRVGVSFTTDQEAMIKSLVQTGDVASAQKLILDELFSEFGGSAAAARNEITGLANDFGDLKEAIGGILDTDLAKWFVKNISSVIRTETQSVNDLTDAFGALGKAFDAVDSSVAQGKDRSLWDEFIRAWTMPDDIPADALAMRDFETRGPAAQLPAAPPPAEDEEETDSAAASLQKLNDRLREQVALLGLTGRAREIAAAGLHGLTDAQLEEAVALDQHLTTMEAAARAQKEADEAQQKLYNDVDHLTASLEQQIDTWGMTADQARLYELASRGATEADLAQAEALAQKLEALRAEKKEIDEVAAAQKKLAAEADRVFEQTRTPLEKWEAEAAKLQELRDEGLIDDETLDRALDQADDRFNKATETKDQSAHADTHNAALEYGTAEAFHASFGGKSDSRTFLQMLKALMKSQRDTERIRLLQEKNNVKPADF